MEIPSVKTLISTYGLLRIRYPGPQFCGPNVHVLLSEQKHQLSCFVSDRKRQLKVFYCSDRNSKEHGFTCDNKTLYQQTHSITLGTLKQILIFLLHFFADYLLHKRGHTGYPSTQ